MKYEYRYQELYKGKRIDVRAHTNKDLMKKVSAKKKQIDKQVIDPDTKLQSFVDRYLDTYKKGIVSDSWYMDLKYFCRIIVDGIGNKPVGKITPIEVQEFLNSLGRYSDSTIKKVFDLVNQIFRHAQKNGATTYDFDLHVPRGRKKSRSGYSLTQEEQDALLKVLDGHRGELFFKTMLFCGLRPSEVSALTWGDIDLLRETISITKAVKKDGTVGRPKSASGERIVPIPSEYSTTLKKCAKSKNTLFCEQSNGRHTKTSVRKMWDSVKRDLEKELGRPVTFRMYDLRHTYCTNLEAQGVPINIASRLMGHSSITLTSRIYTHASDASLEIARKCINGA